MADSMEKTVQRLRKGVRDIARSSPAIALGEGLAKIGDAVIEKTPKAVRRYGRKLRDEAQSLLSGSRGRVRRHQRMRRSNARSRR